VFSFSGAHFEGIVQFTFEHLLIGESFCFKFVWGNLVNVHNHVMKDDVSRSGSPSHEDTRVFV
jgi:hypothetical protein